MAQKGKRKMGSRRKVTVMPIARIMFLMVFMVFFAYAALMPVLSCAQESSSEEKYDENEAAREMKFDEVEAEIDEGGHVWGIVTKVSPSSGSITVKDVDVDEDGGIYYVGVNDATTFEGASDLYDINIGDSVTVDYYNLEGARTAENIIVEKRAYKKEEPEQLEKILVD